jgi:hypothetical protein
MFWMTNEPIDLYKSKSNNNRIVENAIITAFVYEGIIPKSVRYTLQNTEIAGIVKSTSSDVYFFSYNSGINNLELSLVDSFSYRKATELFSKSEEGFDLEYAEEEEKSGQSGGQNAGGLPGTIDEERNVAAQRRLITEEHPGAAVGMTPDRPDRGRQWHQDTVKSLQDLSENINKSVTSYFNIASPTEKQFMVEVMGRSPDEVDSGTIKMTPLQKVTYQKWLAKSVYKDYTSLNSWRNR